MIELADRDLRTWLESVCGDVPVTFAPPSATQQGRGIGTYLFEMSPHQPPRTHQRPPLQFWLKYLVTAWAEDLEEAHRILGVVAFGALENSQFEVDPEPAPPALWMALGVQPQPSIVIRVPIRRERPDTERKLVTGPPVLRISPQ